MQISITIAFISSAYAFTAQNVPLSRNTVAPNKASLVTGVDETGKNKPLYDPFGLYPKNSPERKDDILKPLEYSETFATVTDPLNIYSDKSEIDDGAEMSASLPFLKRPKMLDGSLPGDLGFDPFNFSSDEKSLQWYRNAEIKHARVAMLAAAGWPIAELFNKQIAHTLDMKPLLVFQDRVPSVLNGGLSHISPIYWAAIVVFTAILEGASAIKANEAAKQGWNYTPGDLGFDPFGFYWRRFPGESDDDKNFKLEAELFNGRLAMLAVTGFAVQEWLTQNSVVNEFPIFFKPINMALEQLADASANLM